MILILRNIIFSLILRRIVTLIRNEWVFALTITSKSRLPSHVFVRVVDVGNNAFRFRRRSIAHSAMIIFTVGAAVVEGWWLLHTRVFVDDQRNLWLLESASWVLAGVFETGDIAYGAARITSFVSNLLAWTLVGERVLNDVVISRQLGVVMACTLLLSNEITDLDLIG